jgi:hypothetical protein
MSEPARQPAEEIEEVSGVVEGPGENLPVVAEPRAIDRPVPVASPAVQVAAVAATGLVAGAATVVAVRRVRSHGLPSVRRSRRRSRSPIDIVASRSFLVDIHLLDRR